MINEKRLKYLGVKWILSEHFRRACRQMRFAPKLQKFWLGRPTLPAPSFERSYFDQINFPSSIVRRLDDYRAAASVRKNAVILLKDFEGYQVLQFAVSPDYQYDGRSGRTVKFKMGEHETCVQDIPHDKWFDVRLDLIKGVDKLEVETDMPIVMTMPRGAHCVRPSVPEKKVRHIVLLVLDAWTTSIADRVHPFTGEKTSFPNINRYFAEGLVARNGISSGQWTLPSVGSLFTGQHLANHRMFHPRRWQQFDMKRKTLPEYFQQAGYHTLCGSVVSRVTPAFGHSRGFDRFLYHFVDPQLSYQDYNPALWIQEIIGHLETHYNDSTFSYFQFPDTHPSWHIPPETRYFQMGRRGNTSAELFNMMHFPQPERINLPEQAEQLYMLRLTELDRMFGNIFDYVQRHFGDEALVVVTADHGLLMPYIDEVYKNDEPFLTDVRVNIPLYMRGGSVPKINYDGLCSPNIDIPSTLLALAGIQPDQNDFDGINIANDQSEQETAITEYAYNGVYEIAIRGYGHVLFLKHDLDDIKFIFTSEKPIYEALYPLGVNEYASKDNLIHQRTEIAEKLRKIAEKHFLKTGLTERVM